MGATQGHADARALDPLHFLRSHEPVPVAAPKPCPLCVCCHPAPLRWLVCHGQPGPQRPIFLLWGQRCHSLSPRLPRLAPSGAAALPVPPIVSLPKPRPHWVEGEGQGCPYTRSQLCRLQLRGSSGPKFREGKVEGTLMT